ncbi:J domain-containing protein [Bradyrhizobium sp. CCGE-LA001]|uniref:J domain-containing protein n=1 Tax=Bradyrhizobium sp. CCGE-LA001 TaxID=1223566 RepID=UPI0002AA9675|nr:DnaJ domain-containing protein [Bradyrhizobium sp. CCGE-LA001]AMA59835.1 molecular chaperone DnaJ [Bradyrhizobium sp. CCGE-LA001]
MPIDSSKFFDSIRIKPRGKQPGAKPRETVAVCEWVGCQNKANHRAPKGRENSREYWNFCLGHVREYNHNYNFFSGMNADAVERYQKDALTGHRPTWKMGTYGGKEGAEAKIDMASEVFRMSSEINGRGANWRRGPEAQPKAETRNVMNAERKALQIMGLGPNAALADVKSKYKALVKQHHPDANGGDRSTEGRLIEIIKAYHYLKTVVRES